MRKMYKVVNNEVVFPMVPMDKMVIGETFNMSDLLTEGEFKGVKQHYLYEVVEPNVEALIVTDPDGNKPFAITTNDSIRDNFPENTLAKILLHQDQYILYAHPVEKHEDPRVTHQLLVFRVSEIQPVVKYSINATSINIKLIHRYNINIKIAISVPTTLDGIISDAISHIMDSIHDDFSTEFVRPKYCFNPGRIVQNRLFIREGNEFVGYGNDGKKLVISRNSRVFETFEGDAVFMRCFYSKKYARDKSAFVDGAPLIMLTGDELDEYIEESELTEMAADNIIHETTLKNGHSFFAIVNDNGIVRPIYKTSYGYATFKLSNRECLLVDFGRKSNTTI